MSKAGKRLIEAAKEAVAVSRGDRTPASVHTGWASTGTTMMHSCNCVGPQPGETLCPCMLRGARERERRMLEDGVTIGHRKYRLVPIHPETGEG